jgi:large subunit ribosomal protein L23
MEFTRIIVRPIHTEKTYTFGAMLAKKYAFEVDTKATKHDISIAFESIYGIHPTKVSTQLRKPAKIRTGTLKPGRTKLTKIAYVTLPAGTDIASSNKDAPKTNTPSKPITKDVKKDIVKKEIVKEVK